MGPLALIGGGPSTYHQPDEVLNANSVLSPNQLVVNYNRMKFMLRPDKTPAAVAGKLVDIYDFSSRPAEDPLEGTAAALLRLRPTAARQPCGHHREQASSARCWLGSSSSRISSPAIVEDPGGLSGPAGLGRRRL